MITFVFPGQGSQQKGMGAALFDEFGELTAKASDILGYSIKELCIEDPNLNLNQTQYTQPAIYIVNALSYLKKTMETGTKPDFVAGHSLGEYDALFAAGVFDFCTGLRLVKKRGELMGRAVGGGMAAVVGLDEKQIGDVLKENHLLSIDIANYNSPSQIVISGPKADIDAAKPIFESTKGVKMFVPLKTSGAFHSRYMEEAGREFGAFLNTFKFSELTIPAISNVRARPYSQLDIKENLIKQITHPVKWTESIRYLMGLGEIQFEEIGTGKVLTGLIQRIKAEAEPLVIENVREKADVPVCRSSRNFAGENQEAQLTKEPAMKEETASEIQGDNRLKIEPKADQGTLPEILPSSLGSSEFRADYNLKYNYLTGGMYRGIASKEMVVRMGKAGMMGFLGTGDLEMPQVEDAIRYIQKELSEGQAYGMNFIHHASDPEMEEKLIDLFLVYGIKVIEASAFLTVTPALVKYHAKGLARDREGKVVSSNKIIAKVSRPELAEAFLRPAPERILAKLLDENKITQEEAELSREIPLADDICAQADSGGYTDSAVAYALIPALIKLRDEMTEKYRYHKKVRIGAAGGIGTPEAAAAAFVLGADFILTGSINQCTPEAATSDTVKDLLQQMNVQDTEYTPAEGMFELGAKVQVLRKGLLFPARANKLYDLYRQYNSLSEIDQKTRNQIENKYLKRSFEAVYEEIKSCYPAEEIERAERNPKHKMALVFRWYFSNGTQLALSGSEENKVDFQVPCGPALGAFNQWVKGTELENWRNRHVEIIGAKIMMEAAKRLNRQFRKIIA